MYGNSFYGTMKSRTVTELIHGTHAFFATLQLFIKNYHIKFNKNVTNGLVVDTRSQVDRWRDVVST